MPEEGATRPATEDQQLQETRRWLDTALENDPLPPLLIVIGLGSGHLLDVLEERSANTRVIALEPYPAPALSGHARQVCAEWQNDGRLVRLDGPDFAGADDAWRLFPPRPDDFKLLVAPSITSQGSESALHAAQVAKRIVFGAKANATARRQFAPRYLTNAIRNTSTLVAGSDVRALKDVYRGVPAVIAAAGPSLDDALDPLHDLQDRALLIACDTALRPLVAHGLPPQLVVGVDPGEMNARHFRAVGDCPHTWLVAESALDPVAAALFDRRSFWFRVADHHPWPWFQQLGIDVGMVEVWGSVLTAAFQIATLAGCDPIVLVGADFSWTNGRPYARGTTYEFDWAQATAVGKDLKNVWQGSSPTLTTPDLHNRETVTTPALQAFRDWMVARAARSGRRVINASSGGTFSGRGVEQLTLARALRKRHPIPSLDTVARVPVATTSPATLAQQFRRWPRDLDESSTAPLTAWAEFSGDGYEPGQVASALERAADELEHGLTKGTNTRPWVEVSHRPHVSSVLTQLPEAVARLRAAMNHEPILLSGSPATHVTPGSLVPSELLAEALDLLDLIQDAVSAFTEDPDAPLPRWPSTNTPVSGLCSWPDDLAWPIQLFEALLGKACARSWPSTNDSFFSGAVVRRRADNRRPAPTETGLQAAAALLALEWTYCAVQPEHWTDSAMGRVDALVRECRDMLWSRRPADRTSAGIRFVLDTRGELTGRTVQVSVSTADAALARVLTGLLQRSGNDRPVVRTPSPSSRPVGSVVTLAKFETSHQSASIAIELEPDAPGAMTGSASGADEPLLLTPRILTDEGLDRSTIAYTEDPFVVCAGIHRGESVRVREDGSHEPHHAWPRPIVGELRLGPEGLVAWNNGTANWPTVTSGYVMYRASPESEVVVEDLPFGPTIGTAWQERLYWTCYPSGLGSWAPGEAPRLESRDLTLRAIYPSDEGLVLEPCTRGDRGDVVRQLSTWAWRWQPGSPPRRRGPAGTGRPRVGFPTGDGRQTHTPSSTKS